MTTTSSMSDRVHVLLVVVALFALQFPQYLSSTAAISIFASIFVWSWLLRPRVAVVHGPLAVFLALMALSLIWSEHPGSAWGEVFSACIVIAAGLGVGSALNVNSILIVVNRTTIVIGVLSLVLGVIAPSIALHNGPAYSGTLTGIYISKNALAVVILFGALAALFREWPRGNGRVKTIGSIALYGVVLFQSQSATVSLLLAVGIGFRFLYGWWLRASGAVRALALSLALAPLALLSIWGWALYAGVLTLLDRDDTLTGRTNIWAAAIDAWKTRPILGVGWGSFATDSTVSRYQLAYYGWVRSHAHSGYIQVLTELGIVGITVLAVVIAVTLIVVIRAILVAPTLSNGWLIVTLVSILAHNVVEQSMKFLPLFMLALVYGAAVSQLPPPRLQQMRHPRNTVRRDFQTKYL